MYMCVVVYFLFECAEPEMCLTTTFTQSVNPTNLAKTTLANHYYLELLFAWELYNDYADDDDDAKVSISISQLSSFLRLFDEFYLRLGSLGSNEKQLHRLELV